MAVTNINGQTTSNINTYGTSITNKTSVATVVGVSSSTVTRIASSTTSVVSSTTSTVTSSTTQNINSSSTSKVTYSSIGVSSATPVSSSTTVTKTTSSGTPMSSSTTVKKTISSATPISSNTIVTKTISSGTPISSSTTVNVVSEIVENANNTVNKILSGLKELTSYIPEILTAFKENLEKDFTGGGRIRFSNENGDYVSTQEIKTVFKDNLKKIYNDGIKENVTYDLGKMVMVANESVYTYSSEVEFKDVEHDAYGEVCLALDKNTKEINEYLENISCSLESLIYNGSLEISESGIVSKVEYNGYEIAINLSSYQMNFLDITISREEKIDNSASIINSLNIKTVMDIPEEPSFFEQAAEAVFEGVKVLGVATAESVLRIPMGDLIGLISGDSLDGKAYGMDNLVRGMEDIVEDAGNVVESLGTGLAIIGGTLAAGVKCVLEFGTSKSSLFFIPMEIINPKEKKYETEDEEKETETA